MLEAVLALPLLAQAGFAPPLDTPLRYVITETRTKQGGTHRFTANRRIVFRREGNGFVVEVTPESTDPPSGGGIGAMFNAGMKGLEGRTLRFHLDAAGAILAVDDRDALWNRLCEAMDAMGDTHARTGKTNAVAAALRALPGDRRQAMLGSMVAPLIAGDMPAAASGETPISVPARTPTGAPAVLAGERSVRTAPDGTLIVHIRAEGDVAARFPGGTQGAANPPESDVHLSVTRDNRIDPRTGLVLESSQITRTRIGSDPATGQSEALTTANLIPEVL